MTLGGQKPPNTEVSMSKTDLVKIEFVADYTVQDEHRKDKGRATTYAAGAKKTVSQASAAHFVRRGIAKVVK